MANEKVDLLKRKLFRLPTNPFSGASCQTSGVELEDSGRARRLTPQIIPHLTFLLSSDGKKTPVTHSILLGLNGDPDPYDRL